MIYPYDGFRYTEARENFKEEKLAKKALPALKEEIKSLLATNGEKPKDLITDIYWKCTTPGAWGSCVQIPTDYQAYVWSDAEPDIVLSGKSVSRKLREANFSSHLSSREKERKAREERRLAQRQAKRNKQLLVSNDWSDIWFGLPEA